MSWTARIVLALAWPVLASFGGEWSFREQIVPVLTKAGCNAGACHGAASGQRGFRLSLLGYDPEEDYWAVTREFAGRRIDRDAPGESLLLKKPSRQIEHEGGRKLPRDSEGYETLRRWIDAGAPFGSPDLRVIEISAAPADRFFPKIGEAAQLRVTARYSDGSTNDVTRLALYSSNDDAIAEVTSAGLVTARGRGLTSIMIRFSGQVAAARIAIPFGAPGKTEDFPPRNFIDEEIGGELARLGIAASGLSDDAEFLRRVSLDIAGRLPNAERTRQWLASPRSSADRAQLIAEFLKSPEFVDFWTLKFADLLLIGGKRGSEQTTLAYHRWLKKQIASNTPWDVIARALVNSEGNATKEGAANFLLLAADPRDLSEYAGDILLGSQIGCARCHAHPNDRWTRDEYHRFAAVFAQVRRDGNVIARNPSGTIAHPKTGKTLTPKLLGGPEIAAGTDARDAFARWMTEPNNPFFARAIANRIWKQMFGRGLVEPANDLRPTNPATHPRLLDRLAENFAANHFDLRWLIKEIASSRAYQLSSRATAANASDDRFYSHAYLKPLSAQTLLDAISQVTGVDEEFDSTPDGTRATQLIGAQTTSYALDVLGRCKRERACDPAGAGGSGLAQALHLINGSTINGKLAGGALTAMLKEGKSNRAIVEEFYLRALCRLPAPAELAFWERSFAGIADRREAAEDFLWTLLNSREFAYNH